ncbi:MAG TPA: NUDIX domain-containing protein [bacterium]|nr:NUDIX domain-containing protein [bacterium]HPT30116.1 NUDIX domain-containing protein [bacterium]
MSLELEKDLYFVAVKVFLTDEAGRLLITKDRFGDWDLPGGRLRGDDFFEALEDVAARKISQELGGEVRYELGRPLVFMRHERQEILASGERALRRIFAIGYEAKYLGGEIGLGQNHENYEWVDAKTFNPEDYFSGGWLQGVKDYQAIICLN